MNSSLKALSDFSEMQYYELTSSDLACLEQLFETTMGGHSFDLSVKPPDLDMAIKMRIDQLEEDAIKENIHGATRSRLKRYIRQYRHLQNEHLKAELVAKLFWVWHGASLVADRCGVFGPDRAYFAERISILHAIDPDKLSDQTLQALLYETMQNEMAYPAGLEAAFKRVTKAEETES